jgi:competence protein ComEC
MLLWSIGFQLSFAATAGILVLREPLKDRLRLLPGWIAEPIAIALAAQAAVFPLVAVHFDKVSVASLPANIVAAGLVAPATVLGLAGGVLSTFSQRIATPVFVLAGVPTTALEGVARKFGRSELSQISAPNFASFELIAAMLGLGAVGLWLSGRNRWARWPALGAVVVILAALIVPAARSAPAGLRVTFFDVGQGDAALIESPGGARVLIDGGPDPELIADTLRRRGLRRVDLVVASHLHADHVLGLEAVLARLEVRLAVHPGVMTPLLEPLQRHRPFASVRSGEKVTIGDLTVEFLGPTPESVTAAIEAAALPASGAEGSELNDASVVVRILWGGECVLLPGDLEEAGQHEVLDLHRDRIDCTVLKAPHHGSGRLLTEFVAAVDPEWVAISVGRNDYGHPTSKAIGIFEALGAEVLRTDRLDDVVLEIDRSGRVDVRR